MSLFVCTNPHKLIENTAMTTGYWGNIGKPEKLCSECADGEWHGVFPKTRFDTKKWRYIDNSKTYVEKIHEKEST